MLTGFRVGQGGLDPTPASCEGVGTVQAKVPPSEAARGCVDGNVASNCWEFILCHKADNHSHLQKGRSAGYINMNIVSSFLLSLFCFSISVQRLIIEAPFSKRCHLLALSDCLNHCSYLWTEPCILFIFIYLLIWLAGASFPKRGLDLCPLHWECWILTTGLPGKSLHLLFKPAPLPVFCPCPGFSVTLRPSWRVL